MGRGGGGGGWGMGVAVGIMRGAGPSWGGGGGGRGEWDEWAITPRRLRCIGLQLEEAHHWPDQETDVGGVGTGLSGKGQDGLVRLLDEVVRLLGCFILG